MKKEKDTVLVTWLIIVLIWNIFLISGTSYLVFWKCASAWLFLPAILLGYSDVFKVIRKKYNLED